MNKIVDKPGKQNGVQVTSYVEQGFFFLNCVHILKANQTKDKIKTTADWMKLKKNCWKPNFKKCTKCFLMVLSFYELLCKFPLNSFDVG